MACSWVDKTDSTTAADELTIDAQENLTEKALCALLSAGKNLPKFRSTLQNALSHCTAVVPYMNPLNVLNAANEISEEPAVVVDVPYPKKRVYMDLKTAKKAHRLRRVIQTVFFKRQNAIVAPQDSAIEKNMMDEVIAWLKSDPEGSQFSLVEGLVERCEKELDLTGVALDYLTRSGIIMLDRPSPLAPHTIHFFPMSASDLMDKVQRDEEISLAETVAMRVLYKICDVPPTRFPLNVADFTELVQPACRVLFTVPPTRLLGMHKRCLKHREVKENKTETAPEDAAKPKSDSDEAQASNPKPKLEFAIGVLAGENNVRQCMSLTAEALVGTEAPIIDRANAEDDDSEEEEEDDDHSNRMRAVGLTKGLTQFFTKRLTVAVRSNNAVLVPANEEEQQHIICRVKEWLNSKRKRPVSGGEGDDDDEGEVASPNPPHAQQTVPRLQRELANMCVGKVRRLAPSVITDLLQNAGYISIGGDGKVTYRLPTHRGDNASKRPTWQEKTVESAVKSCNLSSLMRQAYPRRRKRSDFLDWLF